MLSKQVIFEFLSFWIASLTKNFNSDKDAFFVSYNFPTHKIGLQRNGIEGKLSNDNVAYQHYRLVPGLCNVPGTVAFESVANPGQYLRHRGFKMYLLRSDGSDLFRSDACFFPRFNKYFEVGIFSLFILFTVVLLV